MKIRTEAWAAPTSVAIACNRFAQTFQASSSADVQGAAACELLGCVWLVLSGALHQECS